MGVVTGETRRRWSVVALGLAALCALPALAGAWPTSAPAIPPAVLRDRILAARIDYAGYAESDGSLGLPDLPAIDNVGALLGGHTRLRVWQGTEASRVDVLTPTGERGLYENGSGLTTWDFENNVTTVLDGDPGLRLPRAADLVPPRLAHRFLGGPRGAERLESLPARRIAGVSAPGLRLAPTDPQSTVGAVDVWADARTGLPLEVDVTGRGGGAPGLRSRFLDLSQGPGAVSAAVLTPPYPDGAARAEAPVTAVGDRLDQFAPDVLPDRLVGHESSAAVEGPAALRTYGEGFSLFGAVALPGGLGARVYDAAKSAGAQAVELTGGAGLVLRTPLLTLLVVEGDSGYGYVLSGPVQADLLAQAAQELLRS